MTKDIFSPELIARLERKRIIAVLVVDDASDAVPLAEALLAGGIDIMELTLRTPAAIDALRNIKAQLPQMTAGIGTILNAGQLAAVQEAGADFGVAPGFNPQVVAAAAAGGFPFAPGICTPSDIEGALAMGCRLLKYFPAETSGGIRHLQAMAAPYAHLKLRYMPLGGINRDNMTTYLESPHVIAVGGSWLASREEIRAHEWQAIEEKAAAATRIIASL